MKIFITIILMHIFNFTSANACLTINFIDEFNPSNTSVIPRFAQEITRGIELAEDTLKKQGKCVVINKLDTKSTIANIPSLIKINSKKSPYFIGLGSSNKAIASIDALNEADSILITPTSTSDLLNKHNKIFMVSTTNSNMTKSLAENIYKKGIKEVTCIYAMNDSYSTNYYTQFKVYFENIGGKVKEIVIRSKNIDSKQITSQIENNNYVLLPLFELDVARIIKTLSVNSIHPTYISTDAWDPTSAFITELVKDQIKIKIISTKVYSNKNQSKENKRLTTAFLEKYNILPSDASAFAYESVILLSKLTEVCSEKKILKNITSCVEKILPFNSVTGLVSALEGNSFKRNVQIEVDNVNEK